MEELSVKLRKVFSGKFNEDRSSTIAVANSDHEIQVMLEENFPSENDFMKLLKCSYAKQYVALYDLIYFPMISSEKGPYHIDFHQQDLENIQLNKKR